jgi:glycosyltransferase involved in cell wall biosynthesis
MRSQMTAPHIVHLSTYPVDDIRIFQKACKSELTDGYKVTQIVCHDRVEVLDGVEILAVPPPKGRFSRMVGLSWKMYRKAVQIDADIYQFHHPDLILAGLLLKASGKRVIYEPREFFPDKILSMRWIPWKLRGLASAVFARYELLTSRLWDHIIVADRHTAQAFRSLPVSIVPNYPLLRSLDAAPAKQGRRKLLYVGGLSDERGLSVMLKLAELLQDRNVELELMGQWSFPQDEVRIRTAQNVRYLGNQSLSAVYGRMVQADLGLLLLQPVPAYSYAGENTLKLFEYMWCGLPVISSDFPNLRRIIEPAQCGVCVDPCSAERVAEVVQILLDNPERMKQLGLNGRDAVLGAYNWPIASQVLSQVYLNVLSGIRSSVEPPPFWTGTSEQYQLDPNC